VSEDQVDRVVRAFVLDQMAARAAADRDRVFAGLRRLLAAVAVGVVAGIAGGCVAWLVLR